MKETEPKRAVWLPASVYGELVVLEAVLREAGCLTTVNELVEEMVAAQLPQGRETRGRWVR